MKKTILLLAIIVLSLSACKTTEANYRAAYETAIQKEKEGIDDDTYALMQQEELPRQIMADGDTLRVITQSVTIAPNADNDNAVIKRHNVAVGDFRQMFNAKAMKGRISKKGYDTFIVKTAEPTYYVIVAACDTQDEAKAVIKRLQADKSIVLRLPYPCILEPTKY